MIVEVLGASGEPGVDTLSIIREFGLPEEFPEDVLEDAREQADAFDESLGNRLDLTGETIITIDPVDARDFDDAVSLTRLDNGHWQLGVHIADVAHFVRAKSAARPRGPRARHERLSARPRDPDAARGDQQQPGQPAAGQGAVHALGPDGVHGRRGLRRRRSEAVGDQELPAVHLRRGR